MSTPQLTSDDQPAETFTAPHPGSDRMPCWNTGALPAAPVFTWRNWFAMLGPGLVMGGAAIGGGEWLLGPRVTAVYGGGLLWLATLSILGQVVYNIEISRYTLYTGEPIFTGKFRTPPGPAFWLVAYIMFDFGALFPYLAANAATPLATLFKGGVVPNPSANAADFWLMKSLGIAIFLLALVPLLFGGKVYNSLKLVMSFKIVVVFGFLLIVAVCYSTAGAWREIGLGFFKFGSLPVLQGEDRNGNYRLDPGEDWDGDNHLDAEIEPGLPPIDQVAAAASRRQRAGQLPIPAESYWPDLNDDGLRDPPRDTDGDGRADSWGDLNGDGVPERFVDKNNDGQPDAWPDIIRNEQGQTDGRPDTFIDFDGDGYRDGRQVDNLFVAWWQGRTFPIDFTLIGFITGLAAIAGSGGLSNTPISNYTRDQGWGMGRHVGAIPSVIGGHNIKLAHVGCVFEPNAESLPRWRRWYRHVCRDQLVVWMPACFIGVALPSMLSLQFLRRGYEADNWTAAAMTADKVHLHVSQQSGAWLGSVFWFMVLLCGFLVLAPTMASTADGVIRRWVDVFWTSSGRLRKLQSEKIKKFYFRVLLAYAVFGVIMLSVGEPGDLIRYATLVYNIALGFSCWHTLALNLILLPRPLRPGWFVRISLALAGTFFMSLGVLAILQATGAIG